MAIRTVGEVDKESVDFDAVIEHLREEKFKEGTEEYTLITSYMASARSYLEDFTRRSLAVKNYQLTLDRFTGRIINLPYPPLMEIESFEYVDSEGNANEVDEKSYIVDDQSIPARIFLKSGYSWPTGLQEINGVRIIFKAGYEKLPKALNQALLMLISHMYEERQPVIVGTSVEMLPYSINALSWPYRVWGADT